MKVRRASLISITQGSFEWFRLPPSCLRWRGVAGCASVRNVSLRFLAVKIHAPCLCAATENNQIFSPPSITAALLGHSSLFSSFSFSLFLATQLTFESPPKREPPIPQHLGYIHFQFPKPPSYLFFALDTNILYDTFHRLATCLRPEAHCLLRRKSEKSIFGIQGIDVFCATHSIDSL